MTQFSMFWDTDGVGDGLLPYSDDNWQDLVKMLFQSDTTTEGVIAGFLNELAVTGAVSPLSVNTGGAIVYGRPYWSTASENLTVTTPVVNTTGGYVAVRRNWAAQTTRLVVVQNTDGIIGIPAATQVAGTTWDVIITTYTITTLGAITRTDARRYAQFNTPFIYRRQGGGATDWSLAGSTNFLPGAVRVYAGKTTINLGVGIPSSGTAITFPEAFGSTPYIYVSCELLAGGLTSATYSNDTASGFTLNVNRTNTAILEAYQANWFAIGPQ